MVGAAYPKIVRDGGGAFGCGDGGSGRPQVPQCCDVAITAAPQ
jgi:hypothetical protein